MRQLRKFLCRHVRGLFRRRGRDCSTVLPVIRTQLQETSRQVEEAVVGICGNFTGIAARARSAVAENSKLLDGHSTGQDATVEGAIETSRRTIADLLERMERASKLSAAAVARMEEVSQTVAGIEDLLGQIQRIAFANKLVALNAKIEAVHVGDLGSGFEVVADEISRQSERSTELVGGVSDRIQKMRERVVSAAGDLREFLAEDRDRVEECQQEAERALTMLLSLHCRMRESLEHSASENSRLAGDISSAVMGLQFQDRVKQRLDHVVEALEKLERGRGSAAELLDVVHSSYTMESERVAHHLAAGQAAPQPVDPGDMEVELF
jgi:methyl-accepting chemotaxis protein